MNYKMSQASFKMSRVSVFSERDQHDAFQKLHNLDNKLLEPQPKQKASIYDQNATSD